MKWPLRALAALLLVLAALPAKAEDHWYSAVSTGYCETGRMANGETTSQGMARARREGHLGVVAVPKPGRKGSVPLGTWLRVDQGPWGAGVYEATDRIGSGSELDFAMPGKCKGAREWGRRTVQVTR